MRRYTNKPSPKAIKFCRKCYTDDVYFVRTSATTVMMKCRNCNSYIKWATKAEYEGKWIMNDKVRLF